MRTKRVSVRAFLSVLLIGAGLVTGVYLRSQMGSSKVNAESVMDKSSRVASETAPARPDDNPKSAHPEVKSEAPAAPNAAKEPNKGERAETSKKSVKLSPEEIRELGIEIATAGPGQMDIQVSLPGEVRVNANRVAHVVPRLAGVVSEVLKNQGDFVRKGDVMAVLDSRELADAKSSFLASQERLALAQTTFAREKKLWEDKIAAEKDYLEAKQALAETQIAVRGAQQSLEVLGFSKDNLKAVAGQSGQSLTRYEIAAPFDGRIIEKHIALGEALEGHAEAFLIADLSTVWIDLSVYQKDLAAVREGQQVIISCGAGIPDATGTISFIGPILGEKTRTALARVELPNPDGLWRPGLFVTASISVDQATVPVRIPRTASVTIDGEAKVFVQTSDRFEPVAVKIGRADSSGVEVLSGLKPEQRYVAKGAFSLKADLNKGEYEAE